MEGSIFYLVPKELKVYLFWIAQSLPDPFFGNKMYDN
jgi:hypothetical protein